MTLCTVGQGEDQREGRGSQIGLRRAINRALRMMRGDDRPASGRDVLADIGAVAEEIDRQLSQAQREAYDARLDQALRELPERDLEILKAWKSGMPRKEIAAKFSLHEVIVLHSLMRTYAGLRMSLDWRSRIRG